MHPRALTYGAVVSRRRRLQVGLLTVDVTGHNCVAIRQRNATCRTSRVRFVRHVEYASTYDDAMCVNAPVESNVLDYKQSAKRSDTIVYI